MDRWAEFSRGFNRFVRRLKLVWYALSVITLFLGWWFLYTVENYGAFLSKVHKSWGISSTVLHILFGIIFFPVCVSVGFVVRVFSYKKSRHIEWAFLVIQHLAPCGLPLLSMLLGNFFNDAMSFLAFTFFSLSVLFFVKAVEVNTDLGFMDTLIAVAISTHVKVHGRWIKGPCDMILCFYKSLVLTTRAKVKQLQEEEEAREKKRKELEQPENPRKDELLEQEENPRKDQLEQREKELHELDRNLQKRVMELQQQDQEQTKRNGQLDQREKQLQEGHSKLQQQEREQKKRNEQQERQERALQERGSKLLKRETEMKKQDQEQTKRNEELNRRERALQERVSKLQRQENELQRRERELRKKEQEQTTRNEELNQREQDLQERDNKLKMRESEQDQGQTKRNEAD